MLKDLLPIQTYSLRSSRTTVGHKRHRRPQRCSCKSDQDEEVNSLDSSIAALAIPALGTELIDPLLSVADNAFIGRLGAEQLAGVGLASSVFTYTFLFFNFLSTASAPLIAKALASGDEEGARSTVSSSISLALAAGLLCCALLETNAASAVSLVSGLDATTPGGTGAIAVKYLQVRALGIPFSLVSVATGGAFRGMLNTRAPLTVAAAANAVNLILDPILIFGIGPIPSYAAAGAATATVTAEAIAAALLLSQLQATRLWPQALQPPSWDPVRRFLGAGGAVLTRTIALQSTLLLATATVSRHVGGDAPAELAAHQVALQTWFFLSYLMDALAVAAGGLVADRLGRGAAPAARAAAERCLLYGAVVGTLLSASVGLAPSAVASIFTDNEEIKGSATVALLIVAAMQPLNALAFVGDGAFQGAGDFRFLAFGMLCACAACATALLSGPGDLQAVWMALLLLQAVRGATLVARYLGWTPFAVLGSPPLRRRLRGDAGEAHG